MCCCLGTDMRPPWANKLIKEDLTLGIAQRDTNHFSSLSTSVVSTSRKAKDAIAWMFRDPLDDLYGW